ncbi:MAG: metallophosphoesterase [Sporomusaceae bacterium]|nr:metallophosphoesterase [Sporomusaceae bacterium]
MIYVTGDLHGNIDKAKLNMKNFACQKSLSKKDYLIITGDFGCVWSGGKDDQWLLDWFEAKSFTTLWVDGNHENFNLLNEYPVLEWNGGLVHQIRPSVLHLMRGQVFKIDGKTFFTFGGATSSDKEFRKENKSWWSQEVPTEKEFQEAIENLKQHDMKVDYIVTHTAPTSVISELELDIHKLKDPTCIMLDYFLKNVTFGRWFFGHFHQNKSLDQFIALYNSIGAIQEERIAFYKPELRDWKIEKYLSKFKATFPEKKAPCYDEIGNLIDKLEAEGRHITYPLPGGKWNQIEWQKEYNRKKVFERQAEKLLQHKAIGSENFIACASGSFCDKSSNCKCSKLYDYMKENKIIGHTCALYDPSNCTKFRAYNDE